MCSFFYDFQSDMLRLYIDGDNKQVMFVIAILALVFNMLCLLCLVLAIALALPKSELLFGICLSGTVPPT